VIRIWAAIAAMAAALLTAPAALGATTFVVNGNGDAPDSDVAGDPACDTDPAPGDQCTLRAAIMQANATAGADTITFTTGGEAPAPLTALPAITQQLSIDGGGDTTVTFAGGATGPLVDVQAANTVIRAITITGGGSGPVVDLGSSGDQLNTVTVTNASGTGIAVTGTSDRIDGSRIGDAAGPGIVVSGASATIGSTTVTSAGGPGIDVSGGGAAISAPEISGSAGAGVVLGASGASISAGHIHGNSGNGVTITGQNDSVSRVVIYGNGGKPIATAPGANGGIAPPQNLRVGPRRADGSLPLTGTASGTVEVWSGNPASASVPSFVDAFSAGGDFAYNFAGEPPPGSVFSATVTGGTGTSEFATVTVPGDVASPTPTAARAVDTANVRVDFTEPLDPASVQKEDFKLTMAGAERAISSLSVAPDGTFVTLTSSGWKSGEAGYVDLAAPGAVSDAAGNALLTAARLRVAAAPGDFLAPLGARLKVTPKTICLTRGRKCRKPGMTIKFVTSEPGKARLLIKRSNKTVGSRLYGNIVAGVNTLKFNGRLGSRKLRAGRYRLLMYLQDQVGNITDRPPIVLFSVRRVTK
jgi:hypothetical protein